MTDYIRSVSLSRQTKSHEELNSSLIADSNSLNGNKNGGQNGRSVSEDAFAGGVRLAGVNSESAEQLVRKGSHSSDHNTCKFEPGIRLNASIRSFIALIVSIV